MDRARAFAPALQAAPGVLTMVAALAHTGTAARLRPAVPVEEGRLALPIVLFFIGILLPPEMSLTLGGLRLSGYRIVLIALIVPALVTLFSGSRVKPNVFDALVFLHALWAMLALMMWGGVAQGLESGGIYFIECVGAYLMGRLYIRSEEDFTRFATAFVALVVGLLVFTLPEAVTAVHFIRDTSASVFGGPGAPFIEPRMGLERAFGPFDHPILYGVFSAAAFSLAFYVVAQRQILSARGVLVCGGVFLATFISASGGPYSALAVQLVIIGWERVTSGFNGRWLVLIFLFIMLYVAIDIVSNRSPIHVFVTYLTFSTTSAYNRINIFHYGSQEVARHPIFGLGLGDWERPVWMSDSVDNFWLLIAMRYGLPAFFFLAGLVIALVITVAHRKGLPRRWKNARHGWAFTLFGLTVVACTVHLWNALFVLFMFLIGAGVWLADARVPTLADRRARAEAPLTTATRTPQVAAPVARLF